MSGKSMVWLAVSLSTMSACVSGGTNGDVTNTGGGGQQKPSVDFQGFISTGSNLISEYENKAVTRIAELPKSGIATYEGVALFGAIPDKDYILDHVEFAGSLSLEADFNSMSLSGNIGNLTNASNEKYSGAISISKGQIEGNSLSAKFGGNIQSSSNNYSMKGEMAGFFVGANASGVKGTMSSTLLSPGNTQEIYGVFGAEIHNSLYLHQ